jgi:hypothetical protein
VVSHYLFSRPILIIERKLVKSTPGLAQGQVAAHPEGLLFFGGFRVRDAENGHGGNDPITIRMDLSSKK